MKIFAMVIIASALPITLWAYDGLQTESYDSIPLYNTATSDIDSRQAVEDFQGAGPSATGDPVTAPPPTDPTLQSLLQMSPDQPGWTYVRDDDGNIIAVYDAQGNVIYSSVNNEPP